MANTIKKQKPRPKRVVYGKMEDKPDTEQQLFRLEAELFKRRNTFIKEMDKWKVSHKGKRPVDTSCEIWSQMLDILFMYARSMILKRNKKNKKFTEMEEIEDKAIEAALRFMNQYNRREDFKVDASFAGALKFKIIEVLYGGDEDFHVSLNQIISENSNTELMDSLSTKMHLFLTPETLTPEEIALKQSNIEIIDEVLFELDKEIGKDSRLAFLARLYLTIILRVPRTRHIKRMFMEKWATDYKTERVLESVVLEVYNRLGGRDIDGK